MIDCLHPGRSIAAIALATGSRSRNGLNTGNQSVSAPPQLAKVALDMVYSVSTGVYNSGSSLEPLKM